MERLVSLFVKILFHAYTCLTILGRNSKQEIVTQKHPSRTKETNIRIKTQESTWHSTTVYF